MSDPQRPAIGPVPIQRFGKYYLVSKLAEGGMAEIFLAKQVGVEGFEKNVVVKRMLSHLSSVSDFVSMFLDEARLASQLSHPNIVQVLDLGFEEGCYFIAMEYLPGEDFSSMVRAAARQRQYVPLNISLKVMADAAHGLHSAHEFTDPRGQPLNVVHRDVSPSNIFVTYTGQVKVLDFGIAKAESRVTQTTAGVVKGKYQYMAPEQAQSLPVDRRSDVYSMGVCLYESLCNSRPFARDSDLSILNAVLNNEYRPPRQVRPDLPIELEQLIVKALAKEPEDRFQTADELATAIEHYLRASTSVTSGTAVAQYMVSAFGAERVAQKTRIDTLDDLRSRGVAQPELEKKAPSNPSGHSVVVPAALPGQKPTQGNEEATRAGVQRRDVEQHRKSSVPTVALAVLALLIGIGGTVAALKSPAPDPRQSPPVVVTPPVAPVVVVSPPIGPVVVVEVDAGPEVVQDAGPTAVAAVEPQAPVDAGASVVPPGKGAPRAVVLSTPVISSVIRKNAGPVVKCFKEHRADVPGDSVKVDLTITIDRAGRVREVTSALAGSGVGRCLEARVKQIRFPAHVDESVTVTLPLAFKVQ